MTSGGDAAGMNPAIKAAVDHARQLGMNPYVVYDGLEGLIDGKIKEATRELSSVPLDPSVFSITNSASRPTNI